jgi:hypothetical protein
MRRLAHLSLLSLAAFMAAAPVAEAQQYRYRQDGRVLTLTVRPRSFLDPGNVVPIGSENRMASGFAQTRSYLNLPPWQHQRDRFGEGSLPDPVAGPIIGGGNALGQNPFGPIDFGVPVR